MRPYKKINHEKELKRHQTYLLQLEETVFSFSVAVIGSGLTTLRLAGLVITGGAMLFISFSYDMRCIITWMLHQIFMYSDKVMLAAC